MQFPALLRHKKLRNRNIYFYSEPRNHNYLVKAGQNKKRGTIIRCCGIKKCLGTRKKKRTTSFYGNFSSTVLSGIKSTPVKIPTDPPVRSKIVEYFLDTLKNLVAES